MGVKNMQIREKELVNSAFSKLKKISGLHILAANTKNRLGAISFYIEGIHYNLIVKILSDRFGIQVRGGCACAGTYGHFLLDVSYEHSHEITNLINQGDLSQKPGWVRISLHPTMTDSELNYVVNAINQIAINHQEWSKDYIYNKKTNEFRHINDPIDKTSRIESWFVI
jgi:selenocysteine lyase/cysteine desulfurase